MIQKNTKIVCTLGPASQEQKVIEKMIRAGMNVVRLNFSHGTYSDFERIIANVRKVSKKLKIPIAIMQDLQGPKIRVGQMPIGGITLKDGSTMTLTTKKIIGTTSIIPVQYHHLPKDVKKNDRILLCDGMIELHVIKKDKTNIVCKVIHGGKVESHKGINVPTASISANPITDKDKKDLIFGLQHDVDYIALSFVKNAKNITELRDLIRAQKGRAKIIAKIERHEALRNLEEIIHEADGVMVARGDMGVEIPPEKVPLEQKRMIHLANRHGKPVITATEMLQSMIENPRPTRAEVSDVANAIFDHTDAVMLSNESAVGKYPVQATLILSKIAASVEHDFKKHEAWIPQHLFGGKQPLSYATCESAAKLAKDIGAKLIVAITLSGFTAEHIAKQRVQIPIVVIMEDPKVERQLQLVWGIHKTFVYQLEKKDHLKKIEQILLKNRLVKKHDKVVVVSNASKDQKLISTIII